MEKCPAMILTRRPRRARPLTGLLLWALAFSGCAGLGRETARPAPPGEIADSHLHISNFVAQGVSLKEFIDHYMGTTVARSTIMPIPLQQKWDPLEHFEQDRIPPTYYLGPRAELYYYSFVDAMVALEFLKLTPADRSRLDPMITGFNPMDRYGVEHIKRVLLSFPGVFEGIGEFTVHKEIVSDKLAGDPIRDVAPFADLPPDATGAGKVTLYSPALRAILDLAAESGLVAVIHNDAYYAKVKVDGSGLELRPQDSYLDGLKALCRASPRANVIWAHTGLGRFVAPTSKHLEQVADVLEACPTWCTDISWDFVEKDVEDPGPGQPTSEDWVAFIERFQDRVLFGSDSVLFKRTTLDAQGVVMRGSRQTVAEYLAVAEGYARLWAALSPETARKVRIGNYRRLFDTARRRARAWEAAHAHDDVWALP